MRRALAVAVVLVLAAGIGSVVRVADRRTVTRSPAVAGPELISEQTDGMPAPMPVQADAVKSTVGGGGDAGSASFAEGDDDVALVTIGQTQIGPKVVKTASVTIRLEEGEFEGAFQDASLVASRRGGFIASSSTSKGEEFRSGTVVMRVAANQFDRALADLRALGEVIAEEAAGEDVTAQFVDLQARLRNWEAQETVLLRLMSEANTIDESIKVQRNLQDVQLEIERLRGQLRVIRDQTDLGTITLTLAEGEAVDDVTPRDDGSTLGRAWRDAVGGFLAVIAATVVGLGYLIPIGLLVLAGWVIYRRLRPLTLPAES